MRRLTIQAPLDSYTSYGITFQKIFFRLKERGIHVSIRPTRISTPFGTTIPLEMMAAVVNGPQPEEWEVIFGPTLYLPTPGKKVFYWTTFEAPDIPSDKRELLDRADVVMLMNMEVARRYSGSVADRGLARAPRWTGYLPLGVDTRVFLHSPMDPCGFFRFGTAGRLAHGWHRKGVDRVIKAFQAEFGNDDAVRLHVKLHPDCPMEHPDDQRIIVLRVQWSESEVAQWLRSLNCYVSGASYEGFGLWPLQAMAVGRPVIAFKASGLDYVGECRIACVDVSGEAEMGRHMRSLYQNGVRQEAVDWVAKRAKEKWSIDRSVDKFAERLEDCGALKKESKLKKMVEKFKSMLANKEVRFPHQDRTVRIIHAYSFYRGSESDEHRMDFAESTWNYGMENLAIENGQLPREFIDENRRLPYVKDLIDLAFGRCKDPGDVILLSNSDICFASNISEFIVNQVFTDQPAIFPRRSFARLTDPVEDDKIRTGDRHPGWDAFAFTAKWWTENKSRMPDMLMGAEGWDSVMAELVGRDNEIDGLVYHVAHVPFWKDHRFTISSQKYNRALARRFFKERGVASPIDPEPTVTAPENLI